MVLLVLFFRVCNDETIFCFFRVFFAQISLVHERACLQLGNWANANWRAPSQPHQKSTLFPLVQVDVLKTSALQLVKSPMYLKIKILVEIFLATMGLFIEAYRHAFVGSCWTLATYVLKHPSKVALKLAMTRCTQSMLRSRRRAKLM